MQRIIQIEQENGFELPASYKKMLASFELFMLLEMSDQEIDLHNKNRLTESVGKGSQSWEYVKIWASEDTRIQNNAVRRHDKPKESVDLKRLTQSFMFADGGDGVRLYFDIQDNMSVWAYYTDDGSVGKIADSFDEILENSEVIESE
ncbi:SMI1/KNR4 family protein [Capnocytophaga sp.]|uniref:SMI1/KNR4 family protein n=1 Tax=Capnocytophaga sp. TaxID=44737 RepID=UPI0026DD56BF|nr:SMI1/KNR4 family protein [Capnocytophaga sp.]MDO5105931.1 SMI1/KNR4 family protein [Capnocytophaga sp.]